MSTDRKDIWIAEEAVVTGDVAIGAGSSVYYFSVIRGDEEQIVIGEGTNIQENCTLHVDEGYPLTIGNNVTVGHHAVLHGCTIEDGTTIGMGAVVMNGAVIGRNCMVGAASLVTQHKVFEEGSLIMGNPAKAVRKLQKDEILHMHENCKKYAQAAEKLQDLRRQTM